MNTPGFIFDMDDTLAATSPVWEAAKAKLLRSVGQEHNTDFMDRLHGLSAQDTATRIHEEYQPGMTLADLQRQFGTLLLAEFHAQPLTLIPGAADLVRRCSERGKVAVASGSPPEVIRYTLERLGLAGMIEVVVSSEAVRRGKPHPDVFLAAAERLGIAPAACVVFEDSVVGVHAAHAAGMKVIVRPSQADANFNGHATRICSCWSHITTEELSCILSA